MVFNQIYWSQQFWVKMSNFETKFQNIFSKSFEIRPSLIHRSLSASRSCLLNYTHRFWRGDQILSRKLPCHILLHLVLQILYSFFINLVGKAWGNVGAWPVFLDWGCSSAWRCSVYTWKERVQCVRKSFWIESVLIVLLKVSYAGKIS